MLSDRVFRMECCIGRIGIGSDLRGRSKVAVSRDWCIVESVQLFWDVGGRMGRVAVWIGSAHGILFRVVATRV